MNEKSIFDVFNVDVENINLKDSNKSILEWKPVAMSKDNPYQALVRFVPIPIKKDGGLGDWVFEEKPYYMKKQYYLKNDSGYGEYFDSASTVKERCPIQAMYYKLDNSDDVMHKKMAEDFQINTRFWGLVYVIEDPQKPENNGKILYWRFPKVIFDMIDSELNPKPVPGKKLKEKIAVWSLLRGKDLEVSIGVNVVPLKNGGDKPMPNYKECKFSTDISPLTINGYEIQQNDAKSKELIETVYKDAPDISGFKYKPMNDETRNRLDSVLEKYRNAFDHETVQRKPNYTQNVQSSKSMITEPQIDEDDVDNVIDESDDIVNGLNL